jgi:competence protein ComEC
LIIAAALIRAAGMAAGVGAQPFRLGASSAVSSRRTLAMAGTHFQALWPLPGSTAKGNNHSCVVRIDDGRSSILLTGDIERQAEQAMISRYWQHLTSTLIQVPHHGSNTSSSELLVRGWMARPRWHPLRATMRGGCPRTRWFSAIASGVSLVRHAASGADNGGFFAEGWQIHSLRDQVLPRWYHQWFGAPADNG